MFSFFSLLREVLFFFGYVGAGRAFLPPLAPDEERRLVALLEDGDEDAREKLILHNLRLVAHIAKKYARGGREQEDLISIGTIGLIKAVSTFRVSRGALSSYASRCIENEILMSLRAERKQVAEVSIEEPIGVDKEGNAMSMLDLIGTDGEAIFDEVQKRFDAERISDAMRRSLTKRERIVLSMRYGLWSGGCLPQREIASALGISRSYVSRIEKKAMLKMMKALKL